MSTDLHTLSGAYAIDALSPEEVTDFHQHLALCPSCMEEVHELREVAALLGADEASRPPAYLKVRIIAAADQQAQLPPLSPATPLLRKPRPGRASRWTPRILAAAAAVVLIVAAGIGISQMQQDQNTMAAPVAQVFHASDAHKATVDTSNGDKINIAISKQRDEMAVDTDNLRHLSQKQVYQLWTVKDGHAVSVGLLDDVDAGKAMGLPAAGAEFAITIEPAGGSERPTTKPIVSVDPSSV